MSSFSVVTPKNALSCTKDQLLSPTVKRIHCINTCACSHECTHSIFLSVQLQLVWKYVTNKWSEHTCSLFTLGLHTLHINNFRTLSAMIQS